MNSFNSECHKSESPRFWLGTGVDIMMDIMRVDIMADTMEIDIMAEGIMAVDIGDS